MSACTAAGRAEDAARCKRCGLRWLAVALGLAAVPGSAFAGPGAGRPAPSSQPTATGGAGAKRGGASGAATKRVAASPLYETVIVAPKARHPRAREDRTAASSVITADRTPRSGESAAELLSELPGVTVTRLGALGSLATVSLRGSSPNQVGVYLDGIPLNTAVGGGVDLGMIPIGDMSRLEVYRGMSPIGFGASALGGIVSLTTRLPRDNRAAAEVGGGSFGTVYAGVEGSGVYRRAGALASLHLMRSDNNFTFTSDNGTAFNLADDRAVYRQNSQLTQLDGTARVHLRLPGRRQLTGSVWLFGRDQGLPSNGVYQTRDVELKTRRAIAALRYVSRGALGVGSRLRLQLWGVAVEQQLIDEQGELNLGPRHTRDRTLRVGASFRGRKAVTDWLRLESILEGRYEQFAPGDELAAGGLSGPPGRRMFGAAGLEGWIIWSALKLRVQPSVRLEFAHDSVINRRLGNPVTEADPETRVLPIARLSLIEQPLSWLAFKLNGGRYARLPSLRERYGNTGFYVGNSQLVPEKGFNVDAGLSVSLARRWASVRLDSSLFAAWVEDLIQLQQGSYYVWAANVGRATVRGVEAALSATLLRYGHLVAQGTFTDARDRSDIVAYRGKQLPLRPRWRFYLRPGLRGVPLFGRWRIGAYLDLTHVSGNFVRPTNLVQQPARTLLGAGCYLDAGSSGIRLIGSARNLTDAHVFDFVGFPLPGRSFFITLKWSTKKVEGGS